MYFFVLSNRTAARRNAFISFLPVIVISIALIFLAGTIVLALIPVYLGSKTVTVNSG